MSHPRDNEAAEYVLGTLDLAERRAFERDLPADPDLAAAVRAWEDRLALLPDTVAPVEPAAATWAALNARLPGPGTVLPFRVPARSDAMRRSRAMWRGAAVAMGSLAAALAIFIAVERLAPATPNPTLLAVVNRAGDLPALVVRVNLHDGLVQVRSLAAETPADHDLELWSIVGGQAPHSLGVLERGATRIALPRGEAGHLAGATLAVTVEPKGGSPHGAPTTPAIYSGRLVAETP